MNYLRDGYVNIPNNYTILEVIKEADFYQLYDLQNELENLLKIPNKFMNTTLLSTEQEKLLNIWYGEEEQRWRLIYKVRYSHFNVHDFNY